MGCTSSAAAHGASIHELYSFHKKLGQGAFGQVRSCVQLDTREEYAVKIINVEGSRSRRVEAQEEALVWKRVGMHPNVTGLVETFNDKCFSYFVMEKCEHSLYDMLLNKQRLQETDLLSTFRQMLLSLVHCHSLGVVHRDVKPANFLVTLDGTVKLCDFGLAALEDKLPELTGYVGTAPFMSPEMVNDKVYDSKTDIWSMGATAYLMTYGQYLYKTSEVRLLNPELASKTPGCVMRHAIASNNPPVKYEPQKGLPKPSSLTRSFVEELLQREPQNRPSASECLQLRAMLHAGGVLDTQSSKPVVEATESLAPTIKLAQQRTAELQTKVDPTVARSMDELLQQLQAEHRRVPLRSFSLPLNDSKSNTSSFHIKDARSSTHGGELSISGMRMGDELSETSTTASSISNSTQINKISI